MSTPLNLIGTRFGRLTVTALAPSSGKGRRWACLCDCGATCDATTDKLRNGEKQSCGCLRRDLGRADLRTHGASGTPTWNRWRGMINRCNCMSSSRYRYYGARGIKVCERWLTFENFLADMGECPTLRHTIERNDNAMGYEPSNCRWATMAEQRRNTSTVRNLTYRGETLCVEDWSRRLGINSRTLYMRLNRGWQIDRALGTPTDTRFSSR